MKDGILETRAMKGDRHGGTEYFVVATDWGVCFVHAVAQLASTSGLEMLRDKAGR